MNHTVVRIRRGTDGSERRTAWPAGSLPAAIRRMLRDVLIVAKKHKLVDFSYGLECGVLIVEDFRGVEHRVHYEIKETL